MRRSDWCDCSAPGYFRSWSLGALVSLMFLDSSGWSAGIHVHLILAGPIFRVSAPTKLRRSEFVITLVLVPHAVALLEMVDRRLGLFVQFTSVGDVPTGGEFPGMAALQSGGSWRRPCGRIGSPVLQLGLAQPSGRVESYRGGLGRRFGLACDCFVNPACFSTLVPDLRPPESTHLRVRTSLSCLSILATAIARAMVALRVRSWGGA